MPKQQESWVNDCLLWGQLNLQEHDPECIDVERWKDYWRRTHIDVITLNAGGIISYYPSRYEINWRSPWLGDRDLLGELVAAAKDLGLRVLARFTPSRVDERFAMNHPDWCMTDEHGQPRIDPGHDPGCSGRLYHMCINGPYCREWIPHVMFQEIMERYDVDGFFFNAWQPADRSIGPCHCRACRDSLAAGGLAIPNLNDWGDPVWHAWLEWHADCVISLAEEWRDDAKHLKPSAIVILNVGGGIEGLSNCGANWRRMFDAHEVIDADQQARGTGEPLWSIGATGKVLRAVMHPRPHIHLFGVYGGIGRISAQPAAEHTLMMAQAAASSSRLWYHVIGACGEDRRPFDAVERFYDWVHHHRDYYLNNRNCADIAVVFNHRLLDVYGKGEAQRLVSQPWRGAYAALVRARLPFDMLHADDLSPARLAGYRVVVLPNQACLSEGQCAALRQFVGGGGGLVATLETSRYNEQGVQWDDFALADLFGVSALSPTPHRHTQVHFRLEERETIGSGFEGTNVISALELDFCPVSLAADTRTALSLVTSVPHMPPERVFFRTPHTQTPLGVCRQTEGGGRVAYFPCDLDRLCALPRNNPDHRRLLANAVRWALGGPASVEVVGPGVVDVHVYRQESPSRVLVHLVNCTNADLWYPPATEITPLGPQTVTVRLREGERARSARLLWRDEEAQLVAEDGAVSITVPALDAYEVVAIECSEGNLCWPCAIRCSSSSGNSASPQR